MICYNPRKHISGAKRGGPPPPPPPPPASGGASSRPSSLVLPNNIPPEVALDPARNALMDSIAGSGGKRGLKAVPRREKKHVDFMDVLRREQALNFCVCVKLPDDGMVAVTATNTIAAASCVLLFQCNFRPKAQRGCWQSVEIALFSLETHTHILVLLCTTFVISTKFMYKKQFYIIIVSV